MERKMYMSLVLSPNQSLAVVVQLLGKQMIWIFNLRKKLKIMESLIALMASIKKLTPLK